MQAQRMSVDDATIILAASAVERAHSLISTGWLQGGLMAGKKSKTNVEQFCIQGALMLALNEQFGTETFVSREYVCTGANAVEGGFSCVEAIATAYIVQAAARHFGYDGMKWREGELGGAEFNDAADRTHEQVLLVLAEAARDIWALLSPDEAITTSTVSWAEADPAFQEHVMLRALV